LHKPFAVSEILAALREGKGESELPINPAAIAQLR
jgi:hypothetical protein